MFVNSKKYKWVKWGVVLATLILMFFVVDSVAFADVGNNTNYSSGSKSSSSSSSSNVNGIDFYMIFLVLEVLIENPVLLVIVVALGIGYMILKKNSKGGGDIGHREMASGFEDDYLRSDGRNRGLLFIPDTASIQELTLKDPQFSTQLIVGKVNNMFMQLQLAWMNKKWEEVRPFETDALFNTHKMQLDQYVKNRRTNRMEDISIVNTEVLRYYCVGEYENLEVEIKARFIDYVVDDETNQVVKGNKNIPVHMQYKWQLTRKQGVKTTGAFVEATACPNCGANISINQSGKCEYCGSVVTKGDFDWVLSEIELIAQF